MPSFIKKAILIVLIGLFLPEKNWGREPRSKRKQSESTSIKQIFGRVQYRPAGTPEWIPMDLATLIKEGNLFRTGPLGRASFDIGGDKIYMAPATVLRIKNISGEKKLRVEAGKIRVQVGEGDKPSIVETSQNRLTMQPRSDAVIDSELLKTSVHMIEGRGEVNNIFGIGEPLQLSKGYSTSTTRTDAPSQPKPLEESVYQGWNIRIVLDNPFPAQGNKRSRLPQRKRNNANRRKRKSESRVKFRSTMSMEYFQSDVNDGRAYQFKIGRREIGDGNANQWIRLAWIPEFDWDAFSFGLFLPASIGFREKWYNPGSWWNVEDWDGFYKGSTPVNTFGDIVDKIYYIQSKMGRTTFRLGRLDTLTFGSGFLLNNYQNALEFPWKRRFGAMFSYDDERIGISFQSFLGDVFYNDIAGYRLTWNPLSAIFTDNFWAKNWQIGFSHVIENRPTDLLGDFHYVMGYHLENSQKILEAEDLSLSAYFNLAWLVGRHPRLEGEKIVLGPGASLGASGNFSIFHYRGEAFYNARGYVPEYFNEKHYYRGDPDDPRALDIIRDDFDNYFIRPNKNSNVGYLIFLGAIFGEYGGITASFKDFYYFRGWRLYNKLRLRVYLTDILLRIFYFDFYYVQQDIDTDYFRDYRFLNPETQIGGSARFKIGGPLEMVFKLYSQNGDLRFNGGFELVLKNKDSIGRFKEFNRVASKIK